MADGIMGNICARGFGGGLEKTIKDETAAGIVQGFYNDDYQYYGAGFLVFLWCSIPQTTSSSYSQSFRPLY